MAKEGIGSIVLFFIIGILTTYGALQTQSKYLAFLGALAWLVFIFSLYFFRDPKREIPSGTNLVLAPGDGKIVEIVTEQENLFIQEKVTRISIFLSVFDVHVNRTPVTGQVGYFNYKRGKFHIASKKSASIENEQTIIGIHTNGVKILVKQIAGFIARRIVCHVREGSVVTAGARIGMIKFGSRVDLAVPKEVKIQVQIGQKVIAGQTIIGKFNENL